MVVGGKERKETVAVGVGGKQEKEIEKKIEKEMERKNK